MKKDQKKTSLNRTQREDREETGEVTGEDLKYNAKADSFELDPETEDQEYQHPSPYDTAAIEGQDYNSLYDEENVYTQDESDNETDALENQLEQIEADRIIESDLLEDDDEQLTDKKEDKNPNVDQEGYPKKDDAGGKNNPIE